MILLISVLVISASVTASFLPAIPPPIDFASVTTSSQVVPKKPVLDLLPAVVCIFKVKSS